MGPNGAGYAMKLAVNLGLGAYIQALSESLALGAKQGLTLDQMLDVLQEAPYASSWLENKIGVMKGEKPEMTLDIRTLRKDIMSAVATGALSGVPMPLSAGTLASLSAAVANGYGAGDLAELAEIPARSDDAEFRVSSPPVICCRDSACCENAMTDFTQEAAEPPDQAASDATHSHPRTASRAA